MILRLKILLTLSSFITLCSCAQTQNKKQSKQVVDSLWRPLTLSELHDTLETAFKTASPATFNQIFLNWNKTILPNSKEKIEKNDTIKAVFDVFKAFYLPLDLQKLGDWEGGNSLNARSKYIAVQNNISYMVIRTDSFDISNDFGRDDLENSGTESIDDFRPPLNIDAERVLYLTSDYQKSIFQYLGNELTEAGEPNLMSTAMPKGESAKRYQMIRPFIPLQPGHWFGWHIGTHPSVNIIVFNKDLTIAKINFRVGYQGGETTMIKGSDGWEIKKSGATWIE